MNKQNLFYTYGGDMNYDPINTSVGMIDKFKVVKDGVIEGHWHEDNHPYEIKCPVQLQDVICDLLNNHHNINKPIKIKKSTCADTRTCDFSKVTENQLLDQSKQHIKDVQKGMAFLIEKMALTLANHDHTKISHIREFWLDFLTGFKQTSWWEMHQKVERHHFNNPNFIQDDINLIDVLEQITDGVMAGVARSGEYRFEPLSDELLQKAYMNTAKLLLDNIEVIE